MEKFVHYYIPLTLDYIGSLAATALATALIETFFFWLIGYKKKGFLPFVFAVNIVTNVVLNVSLSYLPKAKNYVLLGELIVVLVETFAFCAFLRPKFKESMRILALTLFANLITFATSIIFFYLIH